MMAGAVGDQRESILDDRILEACTGVSLKPPFKPPEVIFNTPEPESFKPGDVVSLKANQWPFMTVESVYTIPETNMQMLIYTVWFGADNRLYRDVFTPHLITKKKE